MQPICLAAHRMTNEMPRKVAGSNPAPATLLIRRLIERLERYPLPRFDRHLTRSVP